MVHGSGQDGGGEAARSRVNGGAAVRPQAQWLPEVMLRERDWGEYDLASQEERATPRFENPADAPIQEQEALEIFVKAIKELFSTRRSLPINVVSASHTLPHD